MKGPYIGPRPFDWDDKEDAQRFFGRDTEASELRFRVQANPVLLLYAQSGAGKTSLLNAKLIPQLIIDGFCVLPPLRFKSFTRPEEEEAEGRVVRTVGPNDSFRGVPNQDPYLNQITETWRRLLGEKAKLGSKIPNFLRARLTGKTSAAALSELLLDPREQAEVVVIFDQFEELLSQGRAELNVNFFSQIAECVEKSTSIRFVFSLRSEWLALFDKYAAKIPTAVRSRFYLEQLSSKAAEEAIIEPAKLFNWTFETDAAASLVSKLREVRREVAPHKFEPEVGEFVEPVQLQIVCQDIWKRVQENRAAEKKITRDDVGNVSDPLGNYYTEAVIHTARETGLAEGRIREWIARNLITEARTRGSVFKGESKTGGISNRVPEKLEEARLVRMERRNGSWYELVHDSFINPILESNDTWRNQLSGADKFAEELRERAVKRGRLLSASELQEAETIRAGSEAQPRDDEVDLLIDELIEKSAAEVERETAAREAELKRQTEAREAELTRQADAREAEVRREAEAREAELKRENEARETKLKREAEERANREEAQRKISLWSRIAFAAVCLALLVSWLQMKGRSDLEQKHVAMDRATFLGDRAATATLKGADPNASLLTAIDGVAWCFQERICPPINAVAQMNASAQSVSQSLEPRTRTKRPEKAETLPFIPFLPSPEGDVMISVENENTPVVWYKWTLKPARLPALPSKIIAVGVTKDFHNIAVSDAAGHNWIMEFPKRATGVIGYVGNFFHSLTKQGDWVQIVDSSSLEDVLGLKAKDEFTTKALQAAYLLRSPTHEPLMDYQILVKSWFLAAASQMSRSYEGLERLGLPSTSGDMAFSDRFLSAFALDKTDPIRAERLADEIVRNLGLSTFDSRRLMARLYLTHARINLLKSQFDEAGSDYGRAAAIDPTLAVENKARALHLFSEANGLAEAGSREQAKARYEAAIREDKSLADLIGDPAVAAEKDDLTPEIEAMLAEANALAIQGKGEEAKEKYKEARKRAPKTLAALVPDEEIKKFAPKGALDTPSPSSSVKPDDQINKAAPKNPSQDATASQASATPTPKE